MILKLGVGDNFEYNLNNGREADEIFEISYKWCKFRAFCIYNGGPWPQRCAKLQHFGSKFPHVPPLATRMLTTTPQNPSPKNFDN